MPSRSQRAEIARQTVDILNRGEYSTGNRTVSIADDLQAAVDGTVHYDPDTLQSLIDDLQPAQRYESTEFQVTNCTTLAAAKELVESNSGETLCLNFASAKNPGGGFLNGSQAQEESLARASGLYACIEPVGEYYDVNRNCRTSLYTHHMIYSPRVPVVRDDADELLNEPFCVSFLAAPAVNAGALLKNEPQKAGMMEPTMRERIERLLAVAVRHKVANLVLGAWGCGVFRNDPAEVAQWFKQALVEDVRFSSAFREVVFAVLDFSEDLATYDAFAERFSA